MPNLKTTIKTIIINSTNAEIHGNITDVFAAAARRNQLKWIMMILC